MSKRKPWLSIVIPAYNARRHLDACISSINPKDNNDVQVILVDDGSSDETPTLCDHVASIYENVIAIHKENGGAASARNAGFAITESAWVWFVDADDLISPYAFALLKHTAVLSRADAIQFGFLLFSGDKEPSWPVLKQYKNPIHFSADEFLSRIYNGSYQHHMCSFLLRAESLRRDTPPFREDFSLYDDVVAMEEWIRRFDSVDVLDYQLYGYRQNSSSVTHAKNSLAAESGLRAVREIASYQVMENDACAKICMEIGLLFSAYKLVENTDSQGLKNEIRKEIEDRVKRIGWMHLDTSRLARYLLLKIGVLDTIVSLRSYRDTHAGS